MTPLSQVFLAALLAAAYIAIGIAVVRSIRSEIGPSDPVGLYVMFWPTVAVLMAYCALDTFIRKSIDR